MTTASRLWWTPVCFLALIPVSRAADLSPGRVTLDRAAREGAAIAARHAGYPFGHYLVYAVRDARGIDPADGAVDAVVLATPIERTRHAAYIKAYGGSRSSGIEAFRDSGLKPDSIAVIVFAHGAGKDDDRFAAKFGVARLAFDDGVSVEARPAPSETSEAIYSLAKADRERPVATITYTFDLGEVAQAGTQSARLHFADSTGKVFDLEIDLRKVR